MEPLSRPVLHRDPPHYLRALTSTTTPRRLLWLHCQAETRLERGLSVERWASGTLGKTWWTSKRGERRDTLQDCATPDELWELVEQFCPSGKRVVLWSYDLAWQLRVSQALVHLPALGWRLERIVLERTAAWATLRKGKRSLMCCDLKSWAPVELRKLSTAHPEVVAIREAALEILEWVAREGLGPFRPTGSGQSYAAFRRRFLSHKLLVHDDYGRLDVERQAMWTGRCEAWRHGQLTAGPYSEYDLQTAYCRIALDCEVPAIAGREMSRPNYERVANAMLEGRVLAELEVQTEVPVLPASLGDRTCWPVGRFRTVLWDPEIELAAAYASDLKVIRAWRYSQAPVLRDFAGYVLGGLAGEMGDLPPAAGRVLKHWSRCLVGRLGLRYRQWQRFGSCPEADLRLCTYIDLDEGVSTDLLCAGHDRLILTGLVEALDSLPQVPGWVMSECRRRLWEAMIRAGLDHVVYVDTDSLILSPEAARLGSSPLTNGNAHGWARKGLYHQLVIHGPRNLVVHDTRRVSGLPLTARQTAPLEFTGQVMRSIKESMRSGRLDHVASVPRRFVLDAPDLRRHHLPDGRTDPIRLEAPCT